VGVDHCTAVCFTVVCDVYSCSEVLRFESLTEDRIVSKVFSNEMEVRDLFLSLPRRGLFGEDTESTRY